MQEVSSNMLIKMVDDYIIKNTPLIEFEVNNLIEKRELICDEFNMSFIESEDCFISEKQYINFSILVIKNKQLETLGIRLVVNDNEIYQISSFQKKEKDGSFSSNEEYRIKDMESHLLVAVKKLENFEEEIYTITPGATGVTCLELKKMAVTELKKKIENVFGYSDIKIYQINRKSKAN